MSSPNRVVAALAALVLTAGVTSAPAWADRDVTITFVRHAESAGNASGLIDTSVPGPSLTPKGEVQAEDVAAELATTPHDGVYASTMIRTQQTAQPFADDIHRDVVVLPGLREIEAGDLEGRPEKDAGEGYLGPLRAWLTGDRSARIPGSIDGNEFDARFDEAVDTVYRSGEQNPVAFSHGAAIAIWTLMNTVDPPLELAETQSLPNTGRVIVRGNPHDGWTLLDWNGVPVDPPR
ncbi:histidine phosphatase family protein [Mycolicibacterium sediminis]|uniref:Phosphoglycerate mutase n=1 Tax=Mycolicibacterium sediminis TaxID=1286180 RepID=A0A7I7QQY6_9MYCO|nr:histidine phosphatase family protein [Mycolicibacterium sediminis]BBY28440.1 phosphoglycerate mutase [Mycolicibacterium sediminis]